MMSLWGKLTNAFGPKPTAWMQAEGLETFAESLFSEFQGIPRVNFSVADAFLESKEPGERPYWYNQLLIQWLWRMVEEEPHKEGEVLETANFIVVHFLDEMQVKFLMKPLEALRTELLETFEGVSVDSYPSKNLVVISPSMEVYYRYVSLYHPDGDFAGSGGMFINSDYPQIALYPYLEGGVPIGVLAHEMTHLYFSHLYLPLWLNEALAQAFQFSVSEPYWDLEQLKVDHARLWNSETIQDFWSGHSFHEPEFQIVSYHLAYCLWQKIRYVLKPPKEAMLKFVEEAYCNDAGALAAITHLELELHDLAASFLGPGNWQPRPF